MDVCHQCFSMEWSLFSICRFKDLETGLEYLCSDSSKKSSPQIKQPEPETNKEFQVVLDQVKAAVENLSFSDVSSTNDWKTTPKEEDTDEDDKKNVIEEELSKQNLYKTELCRSFGDTGTCRYGHRCQFAHGEHELRPVMRHPKYKTETCRSFYITGSCRYGTRCRFIHASPPVQQEWATSWETLSLKSNLLAKSEDPDTKKKTEEELAASKRLAIFEAFSKTQGSNSS